MEFVKKSGRKEKLKKIVCVVEERRDDEETILILQLTEFARRFGMADGKTKVVVRERSELGLYQLW